MALEKNPAEAIFMRPGKEGYGSPVNNEPKMSVEIDNGPSDWRTNYVKPTNAPSTPGMPGA